MKKKNLLLGILMILALAILAGCAASDPTSAATLVPTATATLEVTATPAATLEASPAPSPAVQGERTFTLEELAVFNGKNGQPAYVAVDGVVYDVTNNKGWIEGQHNGYTAGVDLTEAIKAAPHGLNALKDVPVVGKLASPEGANAGLELTLEELAAFDGKDGRPAYVAVDGVIYDMTNSPFWKNGAHNGFTAGRDLTTEIKTRSPHGVKNLERVPVVGVIKK